MHRPDGTGALTLRSAVAACLVALGLAACDREPDPGTFRLRVKVGANGSAAGPAAFCIDRRAGRFVLLLQSFAPPQGFAAGRHDPRRPGPGEYRLVPAGREGPGGFWVSPLNATMTRGVDGNLDVRGGTLWITRSDSAELRGTFRLDVVATGEGNPSFDPAAPREKPAVATGSFAARATPECGPPRPEA